MSIVYGVVLGGMFYLNYFADSQSKKAAVFIVTATISLIFGGLAAKGYP
ncbi:TPA: hypothetical protein O8U07_001585 [Enterobacter kobei]|nr:hypothetical protein [Enterobacter kobei]